MYWKGEIKSIETLPDNMLMINFDYFCALIEKDVMDIINPGKIISIAGTIQDISALHVLIDHCIIKKSKE